MLVVAGLSDGVKFCASPVDKSENPVLSELIKLRYLTIGNLRHAKGITLSLFQY